jgi:hypothetical protein
MILGNDSWRQRIMAGCIRKIGKMHPLDSRKSGISLAQERDFDSNGRMIMIIGVDPGGL